MSSLTWLGLRDNLLTSIQPLVGLPKLNNVDLQYNQLSDLSGLAGLTGLQWLWLMGNNLQVIHPLTNLTGLAYTDIALNWLDTRPQSAAMADIGVLWSHGTGVNYLPQKVIELSSPAWVGSHQFQFTITSPAGLRIQILTSADCATWTPVGVVTNETGSLLYTDPTAPPGRRFYRTRVE